MSLDLELLPKELCFQFLPTVRHILAPVKFMAPLLKRATAKAPLYYHVFMRILSLQLLTIYIERINQLKAYVQRRNQNGSMKRVT